MPQGCGGGESLVQSHKGSPTTVTDTPSYEVPWSLVNLLTVGVCIAKMVNKIKVSYMGGFRPVCVSHLGGALIVYHLQ